MADAPAAYGYCMNPREELVPLLPERFASLLDVGCGRGGFGSVVRARHPHARLVGIEPAAEAVSSAEAHFDHVYLGTYPNALPHGERFDVISFIDVLEHMADPWTALRLARPHLNPGGVVITSIPNVRYWYVVADLALRGNWRYRDSGVLDQTHLRFFTRSSIMELFAGSGFEVDHLEGINRYRGTTRLRRLLARMMGDAKFPQFAVRAHLAERDPQSDGVAE